jgi:DNA-binding transcriptional LysR family regulator
LFWLGINPQTCASFAENRQDFPLQARGHDLETVAQRVSALLGIIPEQVWASGKHPLTVKARSLLCYWAVRELGLTATEVSRRLGVSQPSVSISVKRGEKIAMAEKMKLIGD